MSDPLGGPEEAAAEAMASEAPALPRFEIDQQLAQAILDYLVTRPYAEVVVLVERLRALKPLDVEEPSQNGKAVRDG